MLVHDAIPSLVETICVGDLRTEKGEGVRRWSREESKGRELCVLSICIVESKERDRETILIISAVHRFMNLM
jgi:hypothetical protein